jgi:hypothetical protein
MPSGPRMRLTKDVGKKWQGADHSCNQFRAPSSSYRSKSTLSVFPNYNTLLDRRLLQMIGEPRASLIAANLANMTSWQISDSAPAKIHYRIANCTVCGLRLCHDRHRVARREEESTLPKISRTYCTLVFRKVLHRRLSDSAPEMDETKLGWHCRSSSGSLRPMRRISLSA